MSRASVNSGITPIYVMGVPKAEKKGKIKHIYRNNGPKFSKFDEDYKLRDPRNSANSKYKKYEENDTKTHHNQISQHQ